MTTNGIVILIFFAAWTFAEFHSFFAQSARALHILALKLASIVLFLTSAGIWFFKSNCDGNLASIEAAVLFTVPIAPVAFLAAKFGYPFTSFYGLLFLCIAVIKELWPARYARCGLFLLSICISILFISLVTIVKWAPGTPQGIWVRGRVNLWLRRFNPFSFN